MLAKPSSGSRTFCSQAFHLKPARFRVGTALEKIVSARRRNQHARRVHYPDETATSSTSRAQPQERVNPGAAVAVVVNDGATIGEAIAFETHA